ncbi:MAG: hypothetical protein AAF298_04725 [Cyanobacteria bacterium P01_A01_bin.40]
MNKPKFEKGDRVKIILKEVPKDFRRVGEIVEILPQRAVVKFEDDGDYSCTALLGYDALEKIDEPTKI